MAHFNIFAMTKSMLKLKYALGVGPYRRASFCSNNGSLNCIPGGETFTGSKTLETLSNMTLYLYFISKLDETAVNKRDNQCNCKFSGRRLVIKFHRMCYTFTYFYHNHLSKRCRNLDTVYCKRTFGEMSKKPLLLKRTNAYNPEVFLAGGDLFIHNTLFP